MATQAGRQSVGHHQSLPFHGPPVRRTSLCRARNNGGVKAEEQRPEGGHDGANYKDAAAAAAATGSGGSFSCEWNMHGQGFLWLPASDGDSNWHGGMFKHLCICSSGFRVDRKSV